MVDIKVLGEGTPEPVGLTLYNITNGGDLSGYTEITGSASYQWGGDPPYSLMDGRKLYWGNASRRPLQYNSNDNYFYFASARHNSESYFVMPLPSRIKIAKLELDYYITLSNPTQYMGSGIKYVDTVQQTQARKFYFDGTVTNNYVHYSETYDEDIYVDYLAFFAWDGEIRYKNVTIYAK